MIEPRDESIKVLRAVPTIVRTLTDGKDDAALRRRPATGVWAAIEVVAHMADTGTSRSWPPSTRRRWPSSVTTSPCRLDRRCAG